MRPHHDVNKQSRSAYLQEMYEWLKFKSEVHRWWKTHSSTYGCWICDLLSLAEEALILSKSAESSNGLSAPNQMSE